MAIKKLTGWSIFNADTTVKFYDGLSHAPTSPRPVSTDDLKEGIQNSKNLILDITNGLTFIGPDTHIWDRVTGAPALIILESLHLIGKTISSSSMSRIGNSVAGTWLKIGEVPSPNSPLVLGQDITTLRFSVSNGRWMFTLTDPLDTGTITIYTKQNWQAYTPIHTITFSNQRVYTENFWALSLPVGTEICAKVTAGKFDDVTLIMEVR